MHQRARPAYISNRIGGESTKTLVTINLGNFGSTGRIIDEISNWCRPKGIRTIKVIPDDIQNRPLDNDTILACSQFIRISSIRLSRLTGLNGFFPFLSTIRLIKRIKKTNPDIIHLHNLHNSYINLPVLFAFLKNANIKTIWTIHDCWSFTGHCTHFTIEKCDRWKTMCKNCTQYRKYPASIYDNSRLMFHLKKKWFTNIPNLTIVSPSFWLSSLIHQSFLSSYTNIVIHNGINLDVFKPTNSSFREKYNLAEKNIVLGVAFDWSYRKGLDVFVELARRLPEKYQIILVGVDSELEKDLTKKIITIKKTNSQSELAEIYTAANVFVNPTREEVFGLVNIEALACGTPVITFNTGGSPECIDSSCGIVVEQNDIDGLETAIISCCEISIIDSTSCIQRAKLFDTNKTCDKYYSLYE